LGDAVIGLVVAQRLMEIFSEASEGTLSRWRSGLVSRKCLAEIAQTHRVGELILLGRGERRSGGATKCSILAGAFEALVGSVYLDGGIEAAARFLIRIYDPWFEALKRGEVGSSATLMDRKTYLQERIQSMYKSQPVYRLVRAWGLEHEKQFSVEI